MLMYWPVVYLFLMLFSVSCMNVPYFIHPLLSLMDICVASIMFCCDKQCCCEHFVTCSVMQM